MGIPFNSATDIWRQIPDEAAAFLSLNLISSFFQIRVDERDQHLLSFITPDGKYVCNEKGGHGGEELW